MLLRSAAAKVFCFLGWKGQGLIRRCNRSELEVLVERFPLAIKAGREREHEVNLKLKQEPDANLI